MHVINGTLALGVAPDYTVQPTHLYTISFSTPEFLKVSVLTQKKQNIKN